MICTFLGNLSIGRTERIQIIDFLNKFKKYIANFFYTSPANDLNCRFQNSRDRWFLHLIYTNTCTLFCAFPFIKETFFPCFLCPNWFQFAVFSNCYAYTVILPFSSDDYRFFNNILNVYFHLNVVGTGFNRVLDFMSKCIKSLFLICKAVK